METIKECLNINELQLELFQKNSEILNLLKHIKNIDDDYYRLEDNINNNKKIILRKQKELDYELNLIEKNIHFSYNNFITETIKSASPNKDITDNEIIINLNLLGDMLEGMKFDLNSKEKEIEERSSKVNEIVSKLDEEGIKVYNSLCLSYENIKVYDTETNYQINKINDEYNKFKNIQFDDFYSDIQLSFNKFNQEIIENEMIETENIQIEKDKENENIQIEKDKEKENIEIEIEKEVHLKTEMEDDAIKQKYDSKLKQMEMEHDKEMLSQTGRDSLLDTKLDLHLQEVVYDIKNANTTSSKKLRSVSIPNMPPKKTSVIIKKDTLKIKEPIINKSEANRKSKELSKQKMLLKKEAEKQNKKELEKAVKKEIEKSLITNKLSPYNKVQAKVRSNKSKSVPAIVLNPSPDTKKPKSRNSSNPNNNKSVTQDNENPQRISGKSISNNSISNFSNFSVSNKSMTNNKTLKNRISLIKDSFFDNKNVETKSKRFSNLLKLNTKINELEENKTVKYKKDLKNDQRMNTQRNTKNVNNTTFDNEYYKDLSGVRLTTHGQDVNNTTTNDPNPFKSKFFKKEKEVLKSKYI